MTEQQCNHSHIYSCTIEVFSQNIKHLIEIHKALVAFSRCSACSSRPAYSCQQLSKCGILISFRLNWGIVTWLHKHSPVYPVYFVLLFCLDTTEINHSVHASVDFYHWSCLRECRQCCLIRVRKDFETGPVIITKIFKAISSKVLWSLVLNVQLKYDGINFVDGLIIECMIASALWRVFQLVC